MTISKPKNETGYLALLALAVMGFLLSAMFKYWLGAPNYGLGVVIATALICYFYGFRPALVSFVLTMVAVYWVLIDPAFVWTVGKHANWARITAITLTAIVTCALVLVLRKAEERQQGQKEQIEAQNEEIQAQNEELQAQNEEVNVQNEELQSITEELRETQEQLVEALRHESRIAKTLQEAFLPVLPERIGDYAIAATYEAGSNEAEIGGDFYDIFQLPDGRLSLAIGDASGKGLYAARQAVAAKYGLRFCSLECASPARCLAMLNELLCRDPDFSGFVTLFYGVLDTASGTLTYCSGGHEPPILFRESTGETIRLKPTGRFVGVVPGGGFEDETVELQEGDSILLFTDGLSEARREADFLGVNGLAEVMVDQSNGYGVREALDNILENVKNYAGGKLTDDAAAVLLCVG